MDDKDPIIKKVENHIKDAAKAVEDFADKVAAPEEPLVIVLDGVSSAPMPSPDQGRE